MILTVDANILVGLLLQFAGQALLADVRLELYIADPMWDETERHLRRRVDGMVSRQHAPLSLADRLYREAIARAGKYVTVVPEADYRLEEEVGRRRMPHDSTDWPTIAVALTMGGAIWTEDRHFHGCGIACWTTETLTRELAAPAGR